MHTTKLGLVIICSLLVHSAMGQQQPPEVTDHHKVLHREEGTWTGEMKMWMQGPDEDPVSMPITETNVLFADGLWIFSEFDGGPFQGRGQFGYDPVKEKYVGTWIDNMSPHMSIMVGDYSKETDELTLYSTTYDSSKKRIQFTKSVSTFSDDTHRQFVMYSRDSKDDPWVKIFEITYTKS